MKSWEQDLYWGIKVFLTTGTSFWYSDKDNSRDLTSDIRKAKVFLTQGSAERYAAKLKEASTQLADIKMEAHILKDPQ